MLIRFAYLAILWIFVLSAISVIRSDMFGARVDSTPRAERKAEQQSRKQDRVAAASPPSAPPRRRRPTSSSSTAPTPATTVSLDDAPILIGRGNDAAIRLDDDYVSTRHARIASSGDQWFVEDLGSTNGTYIGSHRLTQPTTLKLGSRSGSARRRRAEEAALQPTWRTTTRASPGRPSTGPHARALRYAALSDVGRRPQGQPGLRVRRRAPARDRRRRRRRGAAATSPAAPRCSALRRLDGPARRRPARGARRRHPPRPRPDRGAGRAGPRARRHEHHGHRGAASTATGSASPTSATAAATCCATATLSQLTKDHTFVQSLIDEGRITEEESRDHPHRNLILRAVDGVHETEPGPVLHRARARRPAAAVQRRRLRACSTDDRLARHPRRPARSTTPSSSWSGPRWRRAAPTTSPAWSPTSEDAGPDAASRWARCVVGAAAEQPRRAGQASQGFSAATAAATPASSSRSRARPPRRRPSTPRSCATPRRAPPRPVGPQPGGAARACWSCSPSRGSLGYRWSQQQYYVAAHDGKVADLPRRAGRRPRPDHEPASPRPATSPSPRCPTTPPSSCPRGIPAERLADARDIVSRLTDLAKACPTRAPSPDTASARPSSRRPARQGDPQPSRRQQKASAKPSARRPGPRRRPRARRSSRPTASRPRRERGRAPVRARPRADLRPPPPPRRRAGPARPRPGRRDRRRTPRSASASRAPARRHVGYGGWLAALCVGVPRGGPLPRAVRRPGAAARRDRAQRPRPGDDPPHRPRPRRRATPGSRRSPTPS